jgi:hypothetical protein
MSPQSAKARWVPGFGEKVALELRRLSEGAKEADCQSKEARAGPRGFKEHKQAKGVEGYRLNALSLKHGPCQ